MIRSFMESFVIHLVVLVTAISCAGGFFRGDSGEASVTLQMSTSIVRSAPVDIPLPPAEEVGIPAPAEIKETPKQEVKPKPEPKPEPQQPKPKPQQVKAEPKPTEKAAKVEETVQSPQTDNFADAEQIEETADDSYGSASLDNQTAMLESSMPICTGASCGGGGNDGVRAFSLRELDVKPKAIVNTKPEYPRYAKNNRIEGGVTVSFIVDKDGNVIEPKIIKANPPNVFENAALAAVKNWRFSPAKKDGETVDAKINVNINFGLEEY